MKITCCILVNNNESTLAGCIQSVRPHVDEVVVVDTGSTDSSVPMAYELGARVYFYPWSDDFSEARNFALKHAKESEWVLVVDSDEELLWECKLSFREWAASLQSKQTVIAFEFLHYEMSDSRLLSVTHSERFFDPASFSYIGRIHERLIPANENDVKRVELCPHAAFRHFGYSSEFHIEKNVRNTRSLLKELETNPAEGFTYRYLSTEYYHSGQYRDSIQYAKTALSLLAGTETYSRAQAHYYKMMSFLHLDNALEAKLAIEACLQEFPDYADPYGIAAEICFHEQCWDDAFRLYCEWEQKVDQRSGIMPNHCISLKDTFWRHKWIAASQSNKIKDGLRKEVQQMKVALLIVHPQLETDREDLLDHVAAKCVGMTYEIGLWSNRPLIKSENDVKSWLEQSNVRLAEGKELAQAGSSFAAKSNADILWIWYANERLVSDWNEDKMLEAISSNGAVTVRSYSERLGGQWAEQRIRLCKSDDARVNRSVQQLAAGSEKELDRSLFAYDGLVLERPFLIPADKQDAYMDIYKREAPLQRLLVAFSCHRYDEVLAMRQPSDESAEWAVFQFYKILASINLGLMEEASVKIYNAMEANLSEQDMLLFIYLYGKLALNADIDEMKREAITLLKNTLESNPIIETKHVLTAESDWLALIAELQWKLGERKAALVTWRHGLESSAYTNETCAYRLAEAIYEEYKPEGLDKVSRALLEVFNIQDSEAQSLLYPIFCYLNMQEWAVLFLRPREPSEVGGRESPLVSILMPIYNDTAYLFESIRSILSQTYLGLELIVVDDGSDEDVAAIVRRFNYDSRLKYYRTAINRGLPNALNYGISKASGSLMGWTSADNMAHPRWLERMVETISAHPEASAIYSDYYHMDKNGLVIETKRMPAYKLNGLQNGGPSFLWRSSSLRKAGGFDESLFGIEDRDFTVRLALVGRIVQLQEPLYYYRIHEGSLSSKIETGSLGGWTELHGKLKRKWLYLSFV
ncbi:glycosyltransferase family 2 protein [Cohnella herbarum]|uniref:Glycosyltransferase n=1 Tax=Cohnella herbarum TaxID=2728023 RepID=A0A7Z2VM71_9BACL|nr:glycosyltransferase [Cohnella herbarum]QJD85499.1 glycosyltransferase [Cohnella herbarum]